MALIILATLALCACHANGDTRARLIGGVPAAFWYDRSEDATSCTAGAPPSPVYPLYLFALNSFSPALLSVGEYSCGERNAYAVWEPSPACITAPSPATRLSRDGGATWACLPEVRAPMALLRYGAATFTIQSSDDEPGSSTFFMCVLGGVVLGSPSVEPTPTASVDCSVDNGVTWISHAPLFTLMLRATVTPIGLGTVLLAGGIRDDGSTENWLGYFSKKKSFWVRIFEVSSSFGVRAHPLVNVQITGKANSPRYTQRVFIGGGVRPPVPANGTPAIPLSDLFVCSPCDTLTPEEFKATAVLPVEYTQDSAAGAMIGWGGPGVRGTTLEQSCFNASDVAFRCLVLVLGRRLYLSTSRDDVVKWQAMDQVLPTSGLPSSPPPLSPTGWPLTSIIISKDSAGNDAIVGYLPDQLKYVGILPQPCTAECGIGSISSGCSAEPADFTCAQCNTCADGLEYASTPCSHFMSVTGPYGARTVCTPCTVCGASFTTVAACNTTHDAVCGKSVVAGWAVSPAQTGSLSAGLTCAVLLCVVCSAFVHAEVSQLMRRIPQCSGAGSALPPHVLPMPSTKGDFSAALLQAGQGWELNTAAAALSSAIFLASALLSHAPLMPALAVPACILILVLLGSCMAAVLFLRPQYRAISYGQGYERACTSFAVLLSSLHPRAAQWMRRVVLGQAQDQAGWASARTMLVECALASVCAFLMSRPLAGDDLRRSGIDAPIVVLAALTFVVQCVCLAVSVGHVAPQVRPLLELMRAKTQERVSSPAGAMHSTFLATAVTSAQSSGASHARVLQLERLVSTEDERSPVHHTYPHSRDGRVRAVMACSPLPEPSLSGLGREGECDGNGCVMNPVHRVQPDGQGLQVQSQTPSGDCRGEGVALPSEWRSGVDPRPFVHAALHAWPTLAAAGEMSTAGSAAAAGNDRLAELHFALERMRQMMYEDNDVEEGEGSDCALGSSDDPE